MDDQIVDFTYVDIDETPVASENNPERELLLKDRFAQLSEEALEVLELLFNTPIEAINSFVPNYKVKPNKNSKYIPISRLRIFIQKTLHWKFRKVLKVVDELREFTHAD